MARRHRKPPRAQAEDEVLRGRWTGLREQDALQAKFHSSEESHRARRLCRQILERGADAFDWSELWAVIIEEIRWIISGAGKQKTPLVAGLVPGSQACLPSTKEALQGMLNDRLGHMLFEKLGFPAAAFDSLQLVFGQLDTLSLSVVVSVELRHGFEVS